MKNEGASSPVERALWFIENRLGGEISLESIAKSVGVTDHHLARAFGAVTGQSLMRYVRGRRLTEAARSLAAGEPDILKASLQTFFPQDSMPLSSTPDLTRVSCRRPLICWLGQRRKALSGTSGLQVPKARPGGHVSRTTSPTQQRSRIQRNGKQS